MTKGTKFGQGPSFLFWAMPERKHFFSGTNANNLVIFSEEPKAGRLPVGTLALLTLEEKKLEPQSVFGCLAASIKASFFLSILFDRYER